MRNFKILKCQFLNNISEFIKKKNINELKNFEKNIFEKKILYKLFVLRYTQKILHKKILYIITIEQIFEWLVLDVLFCMHTYITCFILIHIY